MEKRLYRSSTDIKIAGVCGGIAEYFGLDSTWVRIGYVVLILLSGFGLLLYIICIFVIPKKPTEELTKQQTEELTKKQERLD